MDPDVLEIENVRRHLLGLPDVGKPKASAMADYAAMKYPETLIDDYGESILQTLADTTEAGSYDWLFVAIGNEDVERPIRQLIYDRRILSDSLFFWVEPYLAAGHALYVPCGSSQELEGTAFPNGLYFGNVVLSDEYVNGNPALYRNEYGCQGTYVPYSGHALKRYLSAVLPWIDRMLESNPTTPRWITWVGDTAVLRDLGVQVRDAAASVPPGTIWEGQL